MPHRLHVDSGSLSSSLSDRKERPLFVLAEVREDGSVTKQMSVYGVKFTSGESVVTLDGGSPHAWLLLHGAVEYLDENKVWRVT